MKELATAAGVRAEKRREDGNRSRLEIGAAICEIKLSMEHDGRFQQVRPPSYGYDVLIAVGLHPNMFVYWLIPGDDVDRLMADETIFGQHSPESRWFFPDPVGDDAFSPWRYDTAGLIAELANLA